MDLLYSYNDHNYRVGNMAYKMAKILKLDNDLCQDILKAGRLHDIGKDDIDSNIINKPGPLTKGERKIIERHIYYGAVKALERGYSYNIAKIIFQHHENFDGTGYYIGFNGEEINIGARTLRICDYYDALLSTRSYKLAYSKDAALETMLKDKSCFDPKMLEVFINNINEIQEENIITIKRGQIK